MTPAAFQLSLRFNMSSLQAWTQAKEAFDTCSLRVAKRFAELRGVSPKQQASRPTGR
jgi:hypothetical protein